MTGGETPGHGQRFSFISRRVPQGRFAPLLTALAIYVVLLIAVIIWLAWHAEETTQRRIALSPSISVTVAKPAPADDDDINTADTSGAIPDEATDTADSDEEQDAPLPVAATPETKPEPTPAAVAEPVKTETSADSATDISETTAPAETVTEPAVVAAPVELPAWQKNARAFDKNDKRPRIGLIINNLGMASTATRMAVEQTPADVTLAFQSIAPGITDWISKARSTGHEVLLSVPMEPRNYPQNDPGPQTLLTSLAASANKQRLDWALARSTQIVGIMPSQGEEFITSEKAMALVMDKLKENGLLFIDSTGNPQSTALSLATIGQIPMAQAHITVDAAAARSAIDKALSELETQAKTHGQAIGIALPYPVTFERLNVWVKTLPGKNIVLAPVSALVTLPAPPALPDPITTDEKAAQAVAPAPVPSAPVPAAKPAAKPLSRITPER